MALLAAPSSALLTPLLHSFKAGHHPAAPGTEVWKERLEQRFLHDDVHLQSSPAAPGTDLSLTKETLLIFGHNEKD